LALADVTQRSQTPGNRNEPLVCYFIDENVVDLRSALLLNSCRALVATKYDGCALFWKSRLVCVHAHAVDANGGSFEQDCDDSGKGAKLSCPVPHDENIWLSKLDFGPCLLTGTLSRLDQLRQFSDPASPRLNVRAQESDGILSKSWAQVREPRCPGPVGVAFRVSEYVDLQVARALQDGELAGKPARQPARPVARSGNADDPCGLDRESGWNGFDCVRGSFEVLQLLARILYLDVTRQVGETHPDEQVVRVCAPTLP
jgi:hypothetical protein